MTEDVLGHLGKASIFDLALGATWLALELWCLYISKVLCAVLSHPEDDVHFPDVDAKRMSIPDPPASELLSISLNITLSPQERSLASSSLSIKVFPTHVL